MSQNLKHHQTVAGMKCPWRSKWMLAGMEARASSVKVLASRTSMNGEMLGSVEMTDDKITPRRKRIQKGSIRPALWSLHPWSKTFRECLTVVFLHGTWRRNKHRLWWEAGLPLPHSVLPREDVHLGELERERELKLISDTFYPFCCCCWYKPHQTPSSVFIFIFI